MESPAEIFEPVPRAFAYCRISADPTGRGLGVERQREACIALAVGKGWPVVQVITDNDVSAYSGKARPGYERLMGAIAAGECEAVITWHPDRLHRSPIELEKFIDAVEARSVRVETVQTGPWDLTTPSGRLVARQLGSVARYESEHKSARVRVALEQNAVAGRAHGRRAYGWRRVFDPAKQRTVEIIDEGEALIVQEIARRIIQGDSLRGITQDLNARGITSPTDKQWGKNMVRHVVLRERNAGLRIHHGEVVGEGDWQPILERSIWEQVSAVLRDPTRRTSTGTAAAHLLSGIALCGVCGGRMRASVNRTVPSYRCATKGCVTRKRSDVDAYVTAIVIERLSRSDAEELMQPRDDGQLAATSELKHLQARLDQAADDYADGLIDNRQLHRITERLRPQISAAAARSRAVENSPVFETVVGHGIDPAEAWAALPLSRQRAIVELLMEVSILKAAQGARSFDPRTVRISPRR